MSDDEQIEIARALEAMPVERRRKVLRIARLLLAEQNAPAKPFTAAFTEIQMDATLSAPEKVSAWDRLLANLPS